MHPPEISKFETSCPIMSREDSFLMIQAVGTTVPGVKRGYPVRTAMPDFL